MKKSIAVLESSSHSNFWGFIASALMSSSSDSSNSTSSEELKAQSELEKKNQKIEEKKNAESRNKIIVFSLLGFMVLVGIGLFIVMSKSKE